MPARKKVKLEEVPEVISSDDDALRGDTHGGQNDGDASDKGVESGQVTKGETLSGREESSKEENADDQGHGSGTEEAKKDSDGADHNDEDDDADSDDDGIELVLRGAEELGQLTENPYAEEDEAGAGGSQDGGEDGKDGNIDGENGQHDEDGEDEDDEYDSEKFKFSHGNKRKRYPKLPGRAGTINAENYTQFHSELGKRNTPFEVDLSQMVDKPWARLNASLDDFFNFGFNEQSWKEYAARQVALRIYELDKSKDGNGSSS
mmetsp:Transcript_13647/g.26362  ORF Transcript_13647/g.26362 Transcript_13647/m.26362 type:complete len:262 (+) Transcript_13647:76-861(+)